MHQYSKHKKLITSFSFFCYTTTMETQTLEQKVAALEARVAYLEDRLRREDLRRKIMFFVMLVGSVFTIAVGAVGAYFYAKILLDISGQI